MVEHLLVQGPDAAKICRCMHYHVAQISLPFRWLRAPVYVLDLTLLGVPSVCCVLL